jgi:hypothetical protein
MPTNVGAIDKTVRTVIGAVAGVISLAVLTGQLSGPAAIAPALGVVALILLGTAATSICPLYSMLGVNTCPRNAGQ